MKLVCVLLLLMLVVVWAYPDYGDADGGRRITKVQKARRTRDLSRGYEDDNQMVKKLRKKRGLLGLIGKIGAFIPKLIKNVPRALSPFSKLAGHAMPYVELGITIVQSLSECPAKNICPLMEDIKEIQGDIINAAATLSKTHDALEESIHTANRVQRKGQQLLDRFKGISDSLDYILHIKELHFLEKMNLQCAQENDTVRECLNETVNAIEYVYSKMETGLTDMKRNNIKDTIITFVIEKTITTVVGNIGKSVSKNHGARVLKYGKPKSISEKMKMVGKAFKSGTAGAFRNFFISARNVVLTPGQSLQNKLKRVTNKVRSIKHRVVDKFRHRQQSSNPLHKVNPGQFSIGSVFRRFSGGVLSTGSIVLSSVFIHLQQKEYEKLADDLRLTIQEYKNHSQELNNTIAKAKESQTNCTLYLDFFINQFRNITKTVAETLGLCDQMVSDTKEVTESSRTASEIKRELNVNVSAILLGNVTKDNIHQKQDELLHILKHELFNLTEMKAWVHTENVLFEVVQEGINGNYPILRMCGGLRGVHTAERDHWPIEDVLCKLAKFHPSLKEFDYYNMDEIRDHCTSQGGFPLNNILLRRKSTLVQETTRRNVESSEIEDPAILSDEISLSLRMDDYMQPLGEFPDENEVLCTIAEMFPQKLKYGFYVLSDFRPRSNCNLLTAEKFKQLKVDAIDTRNAETRARILLSQAFFTKYLNDTMRKHLKQNAPISSICQDIRNFLSEDDVQREESWPVKEILCTLGSVAPVEIRVYDHYPVDVIRDQCQSGTLQPSQLQDILLRRKENLLDINIRYHVDSEEEENPETMVKEFADLLMSDSIMESLDISPTEHQMICMIADLYPDKEEYGMYKLNQFRPMEICEEITEAEFQILKEERERRKFEAMLSKYCSDSDEPCFPMTRQAAGPERRVQQQSPSSGTSSCHVTRNGVLLFALFALQCLM